MRCSGGHVLALARQRISAALPAQLCYSAADEEAFLGRRVESIRCRGSVVIASSSRSVVIYNIVSGIP